MAEIKSTMELVLERAARLEAQAGNSLDHEEINRQGMRLAAQYLAGEEVDFQGPLAGRGQDELRLLLEGVVQAFMRNITLPRLDDDNPGADKAMAGLLQLGQSDQIIAALAEVKKILEQYSQHKEQLKEQLEVQFAQQMSMLEDNLAQQTGMKMDLKPSQHPKFAEEWQKVTTQLDEQYGQALEQHKQFIVSAILGQP